MTTSVPLIISPTDPLLSSSPDSLVILDVTWLYNPSPPRDPYEEFVNGPRLPNARFWDLEAVSEPHKDGYALMLPSPERFAKYASEKGISKSDHVVVYDSEGIFSAPRTAWTFKVYGHEKVSVIDGGLPRAKKEGVELETGEPKQYNPTNYPIPPQPAPGAVVEFDEIKRIASRSSTTEDDILLIDARPKESYESGHIPTSLLFDFPTALLWDDTGFTYLRKPADLKTHLIKQIGEENARGILEGKKTVVNTCGGGLSAAINWLEFQSLGINSRLYDESWGGYSSRPDSVRVTGPKPL